MLQRYPLVLIITWDITSLCLPTTSSMRGIPSHYVDCDIGVHEQAAVEEGIVVGGGCTLLRLASKVDPVKETLDNDEEKVDTLAL